MGCFGWGAFPGMCGLEHSGWDDLWMRHLRALDGGSAGFGWGICGLWKGSAGFGRDLWALGGACGIWKGSVGFGRGVRDLEEICGLWEDLRALDASRLLDGEVVSRRSLASLELVQQGIWGSGAQAAVQDPAEALRENASRYD